MTKQIEIPDRRIIIIKSDSNAYFASARCLEVPTDGTYRVVVERIPTCSSLCHPDEPCSLTPDGKCQEGLRDD